MRSSGPTSPRLPATELLRVNTIVLRAKNQLSQAALAEKAHVSRAWISRIEGGSADVGLSILDKVAIALGVASHQLLEPAPDDNPADEDEILRRMNAPDSDFIDADVALDAVDEAAGRLIPKKKRYSPAGRPPRKK